MNTADHYSEQEAIERFHTDMSNSCDYGDRTFATKLLAERIGDKARAEAMRDAWMIQDRQARREARA